MGAILPSKMPKGKTMRRKDGDKFQMFAEGGKVGSTGAPSASDFKQSAKTARK